MPESILGIDLRVCSVKVVELKYSPQGYILTGWGMDEVSYDLAEKHPEREVAQAKALQNILSTNRIKTKEAVMVVGGGDVVVKRISMPALSHKEAYEAVKWKLKDEINFPLEAAVVSFVRTGKSPSSGSAEQEYIAAVAHRDTVNRALEIAALVGLKLISVIPVPLALSEIYREEIAQEVVSVIYMGRRTTNIGFFRDGILQFNREVPLGGEDITRAMTSLLVSEEGRLELKYDEAEKIKREHGIPLDISTYPQLKNIPITHLQAVMRPALEKIQDEILRTIEYFKGQIGEVGIQKLFLTGGASKTPHFMEFLSSGLGLKMEAVDPLSKVTLDADLQGLTALKQSGQQLSAALGAAFSARTKGLNLLPEEVRDRWKTLIRKHLNPVEISSVFTGLVLLLYLFIMWQTSSLQSNIKTVKGKIETLKPQLLRLEALERAMKEEEGRRGIFKSVELSRIKIPRVLMDLSLNLPRAILINGLNFSETEKKLRLTGTVFAVDGAPENILSNFILNLSTAPSFEKVELISAVKNTNYALEAYDFEVLGLIKRTI